MQSGEWQGSWALSSAVFWSLWTGYVLPWYSFFIPSLSPSTSSRPPSRLRYPSMWSNDRFSSIRTTMCSIFSLEGGRSEEHTSELQSRSDLVCRLLLEKKKKKSSKSTRPNRHSAQQILIDAIAIRVHNHNQRRE